jgi:NADP-dependent 3-hydroxy acid dehydrogenase YdfG
MERAEDVTILITGATDCLGEGVATDLAGGGMTLLLRGLDLEKGRRVGEDP